MFTATEAWLGALPVRPDTVIGCSTVVLSPMATSVPLLYVCVPPPPPVV